LFLHEVNTEETKTLITDKVVLATGFRDIGSGENEEKFPIILGSIYPLLKKNSDGALVVEQDYEVRRTGKRAAKFFLNGLCESSHGLGDAGSFNLLSIRSEIIADAIHNHQTSFAE
jgi:L-ornithine N5-oxygenase